MYLDKIVINKLNIIGYSFLKKSKLLKYPSNINEMCIYLNTIKDTINNKEFDGIFLASVLYNFVTSVEVRDRQVTSRIFEDIFSGLFGLKATDNNKRNNPSVPNSIKYFPIFSL